uniref:Uncharacterized protein n=1 Tax=Myotis myotis TaxID=51298 RepID=A0A7J7VI66_MYOMY|nr:hypothetical protein mMyoMyo1_008306 [Myotis myotis]
MLPLSCPFPFSFPLLGPSPAWLGVLLFLLEVLINFLIIIGLLVVGTFALVFVWSEHSLTPTYLPGFWLSLTNPFFPKRQPLSLLPQCLVLGLPIGSLSSWICSHLLPGGDWAAAGSRENVSWEVGG